jgi:hypothetical protein
VDYLRCAGGSLHATGINRIGIIKDNLERLAGKMFTISWSGPPHPGRGSSRMSWTPTSPRYSRRASGSSTAVADSTTKLDLANKVLMTLLRVRLPSLGG